MGNSTKKARLMLTVSMVIFGTIGLFVRSIPLPSSAIAATRGVLGAVVLCAILRLSRGKLQTQLLKPKLGLLVVSGIVMGFNWILLFEAYRYTSVAVATLCYYFAPSIMVVASAMFYKEKMSLRTGLCALIALGGMVLVSDVPRVGFSGGRELIGVALGLGAAMLYATVIMINKRLGDIPSQEGTVVQLFCAGAAAAVYTAIAEKGTALSLGGVSGIVMLAAVVLIHTGLAYALYFDVVPRLPGATVAMLSYLDPVLAVLLSALVLKETMHPLQWIGAALVLGASLASELGRTKEKTV